MKCAGAVEGVHEDHHLHVRDDGDLVCCWCGDLFVSDDDNEHGEYAPKSNVPRLTVSEQIVRTIRAPNVDQRANARRCVEDAIETLMELRTEPMFGGQWPRIDESVQVLRLALDDMQETPGP